MAVSPAAQQPLSGSAPGRRGAAPPPPPPKPPGSAQKPSPASRPPPSPPPPPPLRPPGSAQRPSPASRPPPSPPPPPPPKPPGSAQRPPAPRLAIPPSPIQPASLESPASAPASLAAGAAARLPPATTPTGQQVSSGRQVSNDTGRPSEGAPRAVAGSPAEDAGQNAPEYCTAILTLLKVGATRCHLSQLGVCASPVLLLTGKYLCHSRVKGC